MSGTAPRRPVVDVHTPAPLAAQRLRNTLRLNAFTSMLGGLAATVAPGPLDNHLLGTGHPGWVRLVGVGLIVFASTVAAVGGSRTTTLLRGTPAIIAADTAWVVASAMTIVGNWYSSSGAATIAAVAGMVAFFAVRQTFTLRVTRSTAKDIAAINESPPVEVVHNDRGLPATGIGCGL